MKEDKDLLKKYGKKNPFTVPEGYFQDFSEKLMEQLPEKEVMPEPEIRMWDRIKPWVYMAAMFVHCTRFRRRTTFITKHRYGNWKLHRNTRRIPRSDRQSDNDG